MWRLLFELGVGSVLVYGILYCRQQYLEAVIHHHDAAILWQRMMMNIMSEQVGRYFKNTHVNNHIVYLRGAKIDISIGDEDVLIPVDMDLFKEDIDKAFEDAYNRFVIHVR
jgi:hypothetical protein